MADDSTTMLDPTKTLPPGSVAALQPKPLKVPTAAPLNRKVSVPALVNDPYAEQKKFILDQLKANESKTQALETEANQKRDELEQRRAAETAAERKQLEEHQKTKPEPLANFDFKPKDVSDFSGMLLVLAALGGALTRAPLTASMNNISGMINGMVQGNNQQFENQYKQFQANYQKGMSAHQAYNDDLNALKEKHKGDHEAFVEEKQLLDARYGKQGELLKQENQTLQTYYKNIHDEQSTAVKAAEESDRFAKLLSVIAESQIKNAQFEEKMADLQKQLEEKTREFNAKEQFQLNTEYNLENTPDTPKTDTKGKQVPELPPGFKQD